MADVAVDSNVEKPLAPVPVPEPEPETAEKPIEKAVEAEEEKVVEAAKIVPVDLQKKALEELKALVQEALKNHEFSPPPAKVEEEKALSPVDTTTKTEEVKETPVADVEVAEEEKTVSPPPPAPESTEPEEKHSSAAAVVVDEDGAKTVEAIEETVVSSIPHAPLAEQEAPPQAEPEEEKLPEEVSIWGVPLLEDERSDVVLLKFLRARDFKPKEALAMLKKTVQWRKDFAIDSLLEESLDNTCLEKFAFLNGFDKSGNPMCYNVFGAFQDKELYKKTFADKEKRGEFLRWMVQFMEKNVRKMMDFSPEGVCSFVFVNDLKNSPPLALKKELRSATYEAMMMLQDNYPEFVAKQVFINVPWWYVAFYGMISPFLTQRTKSKFVFAASSRSLETLFKFIAPEQLAIEYGGVSKEGEQEFTKADPVTEEIIKPSTTHTVEFPIAEACDSVWEVRVNGWEVSYGAEFVPNAGYTTIVQKPKKISQADETVINGSFKVGEPGKVVLTFDNQTSKKKRLFYRSKAKPSAC